MAGLFLPLNDAAPGALHIYREANDHYRTVPWPAPFEKTTHRLYAGDARDLSFIPDSSVHLVVTSPPYWTLKEYEKGNHSQLGDIEDYEKFLKELDKGLLPVSMSPPNLASDHNSCRR